MLRHSLIAGRGPNLVRDNFHPHSERRQRVGQPDCRTAGKENRRTMSPGPDWRHDRRFDERGPTAGHNGVDGLLGLGGNGIEIRIDMPGFEECGTLAGGVDGRIGNHHRQQDVAVKRQGFGSSGERHAAGRRVPLNTFGNAGSVGVQIVRGHHFEAGFFEPIGNVESGLAESDEPD